LLAHVDRYKEISNKIQSILEYTDMVEPLSLDEAYLDVTKIRKVIKRQYSGRRNSIAYFNEVGLTASAGISVNKFVAKIASDYNLMDKKVNRGCNTFFGRITHSKILWCWKSDY
jgi:nucleotidyltransferase/DNA polymerase involved in DNA repair